VLTHLKRLALAVGREVVINVNDLLKVELLKIDVKSSDQKVNDISLLKLAISQRFQRFQNVA